MNFILEKVPVFTILLLVVLLPIFFIPVNINFIQFGTSLIFAFGTIISFSLFSISIMKKGQVEILKNKITPIIFLLIPLIYLISFFSNIPTKYAFFGYIFDATTVGFVILSFMFMFLVSVLFKNKDKVFYGYIAVILSSLILAFVTLLRIVFGADFLSFGMFSSITQSTLGSFNNFGIFFGVSSILSMISLEMIDFSKVMRVLVNICFGLSILFMFMVDFELIWYCTSLISIIFFVYNTFVNKDVTQKPKWKSYALILFVISLFFLFVKYPHNLFVKKFEINSLEVRPSMSITYDIFKSTMKDNIFLGSGPNTFISQWIINKPINVNETVFWNTDFQYGFGLIPTYILTTGILGLISWLLFFVVYVFIGIKNLFNRSGDKIDDYLSVSSFFISLFLWIIALFYIPTLPLFILTLFITGLFLSKNYVYKEESKLIIFKDSPKIGFLVSLIVTASIVFMLFLAFNIYKSSSAMWNLQKGLKVVQNGDIESAEKYIDKSILKFPYDIYYRSKADISVIKIEKLLSSNIDKENLQSAQNTFINELQKAIESSVKAKDINPKSYLNWVYMGNSYSLAVPKSYRINGAYESALSAYNQAMILNPKNPAIPLLMARLEVDNENNKKAKEYINDSISKKANYLDAYYLLAQIQLSENNTKEAIKSVETAVIIDPTNPALLFQLGLLYYNSGNYKDASGALSKSLELSPEYANARYFLGLSFARLGDYKSAVVQLEEVLKTNPDSKDVVSVINLLNSGKSPFEDIKSDTKNKSLPLKESN